MSDNRKFSMNVEDHQGLLHKFARGGYARMISAGYSIDYEDVYQEMCLSFVKASKKYNPESGVGFSAYMGRTAMNNFNRFAERELEKHFGLGILHIEDLSTHLDESMHDDPYEFMIADQDQEHIEDIVAHRSEMKRMISRLSNKARKVIRELINPSEDILAHHQREYNEMQELKANGESYSQIPVEITLRYITRFYKFKHNEIIDEIQTRLGIKL